jgi:hypothetical protein
VNVGWQDAGLTMAYAVLIDLMVVCPLVRLLSVSMKESARRRSSTP